MSNFTDQSVQLILTHMDKLAEKLGIGAGEIFGWYVKQIWIDFYLQLVWLSLIGVVIITVFKVAISFKKDEKEEYDKMDDTKKEILDKQGSLSSMIFGVACFFGIVEIGILIITLMVKIPALLNINYHAFNDLISRLSTAL